MKKYRMQTRNKWNYDLFIKDNEALSRPERNIHRDAVVQYVLRQKKLNYFDIRFLKRLECYVDTTTGKKSISLIFKGTRLPLHEKYTFDYQKDQMKIFAKKYFKNETGHRLTIAIIIGMPLQGDKLSFKNKDKENEFIYAMIELIDKTQIMTRKTFAERIIRATNTTKKKYKTILDYSRRL